MRGIDNLTDFADYSFGIPSIVLCCCVLTSILNHPGSAFATEGSDS